MKPAVSLRSTAGQWRRTLRVTAGHVDNAAKNKLMDSETDSHLA
jgi:hypothetical protein